MSLLDELACKQHAVSGFDSACDQCVQAVFRMRNGEAGAGVGVLHVGDDPTEASRRAVMGLLVVASPTIARRAYWALNSAIVATIEVHKKAVPQARKDADEHIAILRNLMDLMKDCVEKPVR
jgi:hypothetical protein